MAAGTEQHNSLVTVLRQSTTVPKTSVNRALGGLVVDIVRKIVIVAWEDELDRAQL